MSFDFRKKYWCASCDKPLPITPAMYSVGDKVSFTKCVSSGNRIRMTAVTGIVAAVGEKTVQLQYRGELKKLSFKDVAPAEAPNQLTRSLCGECECPKEVADEATAIEHNHCAPEL